MWTQAGPLRFFQQDGGMGGMGIPSFSKLAFIKPKMFWFFFFSFVGLFTLAWLFVS